eukprot:CAMPEP_0172034972 /NCGR_PEP_ID=MMETSP1041-20130122/21317_1 /TAXON_ID=464988 /ORGANISM="Hemiselmis andersenii, Strain CCMP439" /LENGTH=83 /DNA_ID=CAMNT_0012691973 /DNA_START=37 /DNA_END=288 /DNA_ORIENTATION=+
MPNLCSRNPKPSLHWRSSSSSKGQIQAGQQQQQGAGDTSVDIAGKGATGGWFPTATIEGEGPHPPPRGRSPGQHPAVNSIDQP